MKDKADAVLIGAGHNSLACACHLAAQGWRVAVFEQAPQPGGAVKSGEYTLPGFRHDWAAMNLSQFAGSWMMQTHGEELKRHGLAFVPTDHPFASVFPGGDWMGVTKNADRTIDRIRTFAGDADADAWRKLTDEFPERAEMVFALLGSPMSTRGLASLGWKGLRGMGGSSDLVNFLISSPRAWLDSLFTSPELKAMMATWGMHLDFAPDVAGGALFPWLECMGGQAQGMVIGQNGADTITTAMVRMIEARGGSVTCNAPVASIETAGGAATGITLEDGTFVSAEKAVIANVSPGALLRLTGGTGDARHEAAMRGFTHAPGTMMIHLAMDALPDWTAGTELKDYAYVNLAPSMEMMARTYAQAQAGLLPDEPVVIVGQPTAIDPGRAPEGKHILWLQVRMAPGQISGDAKGEIAAKDWDSAAEPFAERALDILESYAPGTRDKILGRHVVTPVMLEADNPNLVGGDQVCGSHHLHQHFMYRPARGYADGTTPIDRLYHTGAAVWPGGGAGAGPGGLLARKLAGK